MNQQNEMRYLVIAALLFFGPALQARAADQNTKSHYDVVIYGTTPGGIAAARTIAEKGYSVAVVDPRNHIGGILTSGLSGSDVCQDKFVGGYARKFFEKIGEHYNRKLSWRFEPHVALELSRQQLSMNGISLFLRDPLRSVRKKGAVLQAIATASGKEYSGRIFIDATYEGDLLAAAKVSFTVGREAADKYDESLAGFYIPSGSNRHVLPVPLPKDPAWSLDAIPNVLKPPFPKLGSGDSKLQAYNYRLCVTEDSANSIKFTQPENYKRESYLPISSFVKAKVGRGVFSILTPLNLTKGKIDLNGGGPFSTDYVGMNWRYAEASFEERLKIEKAHRLYTQGLLFFLANDRSVPDFIRKEVQKWGLCKDEFVDNGNWPPILYVREGRRLLGEYVLNQNDLISSRRKNDSIAMATCPIESHATQRLLIDGKLVNEGVALQGVKPYQIPYRSIIPREKEASNLLVPVSISASHIAYSSLRMEPVFMMLGEGAGIAAVIALETKSSVQDINLERLRADLLNRGAVLGEKPSEPTAGK